MRKKRESIPGDDGRTVAPMNVEGMPWHIPSSGNCGSAAPQSPYGMDDPLQDPKNRRAMLFGALKATLLVTSVFLIAFLVFILFCINVWFK